MGPLNIVVCLKPVPDPEKWHEIRIDKSTGTLRRDGITQITNPLDKNALEAALQLKEAHGGSVTVITMGPAAAAENLAEALAAGADRAVLLSDSSFAGADTLATSRVLATGIRKIIPQFDLVLCGARSLDGSTAQVGPQLAVQLDVQHISGVTGLVGVEDRRIELTMKMDWGKLRLSAEFPLVLTVLKETNTPRTPTLMGIISARGKETTVLCATDLELGPSETGLGGSPTRPGSIFYPDLNRKGHLLTGGPEEAARKLLSQLGLGGYWTNEQQ